MQCKIFQIDAFADQPFTGNPAAVIPLDTWLNDATMQAIAAENNLSETSFFVKENDCFRIRWFTPTQEVRLCGHATLASAYVIFNYLGFTNNTIHFDSLSGPLAVSRSDQLLTLDFPLQMPAPCEPPDALVSGLGIEPVGCLKNEDYIAVLENEEAVLNLMADYGLVV